MALVFLHGGRRDVRGSSSAGFTRAKVGRQTAGKLGPFMLAREEKAPGSAGHARAGSGIAGLRGLCRPVGCWAFWSVLGLALGLFCWAPSLENGPTIIR